MKTKYTPIEEQCIFRFPNGYGASVIRNSMSYGYNDGFYELAFIKFPDQSNLWDLVYDLDPIPDVVVGWLTMEDVESYLDQIAALEAPCPPDMNVT